MPYNNWVILSPDAEVRARLMTGEHPADIVKWHEDPWLDRLIEVAEWRAEVDRSR